METDTSILDEKVGVHLYKYGVDLVIANILGQHSHTVYFYQDGVPKVQMDRTEEDVAKGIDIEKKMIVEIAKRHTEWRQQQQQH